MTYAFTFDARFCSGCKACLAACKDKNNLPTGVLWRRVIEVTGGTWQKQEHAWNNTVFAYNLSISCNHCAHPKCAGVCPTDAYVLREDGIVFLDTTKCVGCGYCAWACPYGAPQYNADAGHMSKCDFCFDNLEQGLPPACVAACPLRVLDYGETTTIGTGWALWETPSEKHPFPMPNYSHTQPHLAITPHLAMSAAEMKSIANIEEIKSRTQSSWEELPLMLFTLLAQLAVGGFWAMSLMFPLLWSLVEYDAIWLRLLPSALIGASLGMGMAASFAHLGTKKNAWRVLNHWRKSSLSREILFAGLFGVSWLFTALEILLRHSTFESTAITSILGIGLIYSMSQVYRFPAAPGWNTWRTNAGFMISASLLGVAVMTPLLAYESSITNIQVPIISWIIIGGCILLLLVTQLAIMPNPFPRNLPHLVRIGLIFIAIMVNAIAMLRADLHATSVGCLLFLLIAIEECIGRWLFYESRLADTRQSLQS